VTAFKEPWTHLGGRLYNYFTATLRV